MDTAEGYVRLGEAAANRRIDLDRTQMEIAQAGGLSLDRVSTIERGEARNLRPKTIRALERGLDWREGSVRAVLAGGEPTPREQRVPIGQAVENNSAAPVEAEEDDPKMQRAMELMAEAQALLAEIRRERREGA